MERFEVSAAPHNLPEIFDEYSLAAVIGTTLKQLWYYIKFNNDQYSIFYIDKDTREIVSEPDPSRRLRTISAPKPGLKYVQGSLAYNIFRKLPMHPANFAYMKGKSIKHAAEKQLPNEVLVKVDLVDFFGSHTERYVIDKLEALTGYSNRICWMIAKLCCKNGRLPQGSPASPVLSIVLNHELDIRLEALATEGISYARYADDITYSGPDKSNTEYWKLIKDVARVVYPFKVNWDKVDIMRTAAYKYICGFIIDPSLTPIAGMHLTTTSDSKFKYTRREPLTEEQITAMIQDTPYTPVYYYVQDIRHMLGLNLSEEVKIPRFKYSKMRQEAMLAGLGYTNEAKFKGRLSYLRSIEPSRADKIESIFIKYKEMEHVDSSVRPEGISEQISH
jgi:hypothetical protein